MMEPGQTSTRLMPSANAPCAYSIRHQMSRLWVMVAVLGLLMGLGLPAGAESGTRVIPRPLPSHPGNIFLAGEQVSVATPSGGGDSWRAIDYEGKTVAEGRVEEGRAELGKLPG